MGININDGFGCQACYIASIVGTKNRDDALTGLSILITDEEDPSLQNLAEGTEGNYRYLIEERDLNNPNKVYSDSPVLRRSDSPIFFPVRPFIKQTTNINEGRDGYYLYLTYALTYDLMMVEIR